MVQLGVSLLWQNKHADAIELFERAIELSPELAEAYYNLALAQSSLGDGNSAKMAFAHTIRLNPGIAEAYVGLATLFIQDNELANALKTVRKGLEASPEHPGLKRLLDGFEIQR
jgi:tetratricopeptide (TPR) repeat protein